MALTACVGPTARVGPTGPDWLAKCPPESRKAVHELRIEPDLGLAEALEGPSVVLQDFGKGLEVRDGPVEVSALMPARGGAVVARLFCAYASLPGYMDDFIPEAIDPPPASERHSGFMFVVTQQLGIHFAH